MWLLFKDGNSREWKVIQKNMTTATLYIAIFIKIKTKNERICNVIVWFYKLLYSFTIIESVLD